MARTSARTVLGILLLTPPGLFLTGPRAEAQTPGPVAVVAHPQAPVDDLSFVELRRLFLGDRLFWSSNLRVTVLVPLRGTRERVVLLEKIYEKTEAQYRHYWIAKVFRAEVMAAPKIISNREMAAELLRAVPGAISLMEAANVPSGVKVLKIEGKRPGDPGYPLR